MCSRLSFALLLVFVLVLPPPLAQASARTVQGRVTDQNGNPLKGAVVKIKNAISLRVRSYITRKDGRYSFHGLNPDADYELKAEYEGRSSSKRLLSRFDSREVALIDLRVESKQ
jgi:hypothetical protein